MEAGKRKSPRDYMILAIEAMKKIYTGAKNRSS